MRDAGAQGWKAGDWRDFTGSQDLNPSWGMIS